MPMDGNALEIYMGGAIDLLVLDVLKATVENPKETVFLLKYSAASKKAHQIRTLNEERGLHIPPFLIASIAANCNLHCQGCYARANHMCGEGQREEMLSDVRWGEIFSEAEALGISFILLAGGEPLLREGVIRQAAEREKIIFPIFTNGTILDKAYLKLFERRRNLIPILSLEGDEEKTDSRRGQGTYRKIKEAMRQLCEKKILFGASITVTTENLRQVLEDEFIASLRKSGCRIVFLVEYVPVEKGSERLAPAEAERVYMEERLAALREKFAGMIFMAFPGDEKFTGGCVAAGRGFFHINPYGGAEPCPFSPYSDRNLKTCNLREALESPLFYELKVRKLVGGEHIGGCALFIREEAVKELCKIL